MLAKFSPSQINVLKEKLTSTIINEMKKQKLSQSQVGKLSGMSRVNINKTLNRTERGISIDQLVRIANAIDLDIRLIIKRKQK